MAKTWYCKVTMPEGVDIPFGGDFTPRQAVKEAMWVVTGVEPESVASGWAPLPLTEEEKTYYNI